MSPAIKMKIVQLPTTVLIDNDISFEAKGVYCYLYSRYHFNGYAIVQSNTNQKKLQKSIKELIKHKYISIKNNNVFFLK